MIHFIYINIASAENDIDVIYNCKALPRIIESAKKRLEMAKTVEPIEEPSDNYLKPFETDGCSISPDSSLTSKKSYLPCCIQHDYNYWLGGSESDRLNADQTFYACMKTVASTLTAYSYYRAVRISGGPRTGLPFKWGYGWSKNRLWKEINSSHVSFIEELTEQYLTNTEPLCPS